jgi:hypothetical protein
MTVFWDDALRSLVELGRCFGGAYCLHRRPDDGGSKHLWDVYIYLQVHTHKTNINIFTAVRTSGLIESRWLQSTWELVRACLLLLVLRVSAAAHRHCVPLSGQHQRRESSATVRAVRRPVRELQWRSEWPHQRLSKIQAKPPYTCLPLGGKGRNPGKTSLHMPALRRQGPESALGPPHSRVHYYASLGQNAWSECICRRWCLFACYISETTKQISIKFLTGGPH